jgi:hypothetical protein
LGRKLTKNAFWDGFLGILGQNYIPIKKLYKATMAGHTAPPLFQKTKEKVIATGFSKNLYNYLYIN